MFFFWKDLFNSAFEGFKYQGDFGAFKAEKNILFQASSYQIYTTFIMADGAGDW